MCFTQVSQDDDDANDVYDDDDYVTWLGQKRYVNARTGCKKCRFKEQQFPKKAA